MGYRSKFIATISNKLTLNMSLELNDWVEYSRGHKDFDKKHFYTLLMDNDNGKAISDEEYLTVFEHFPNYTDLITRLKRYYSASRPIEIDNLEQFLIQKVKKDIEQKCRAIDDKELLSILNKDIKFIEDFNKVDAAQLGDWHGEFMALLVDYILDNRYSKDRRVYALFESFYGLTHNYHLVWYLGSPLIDVNINFDYYFDIWTTGGEYAITENGVIVSKRNN